MNEHRPRILHISTVTDPCSGVGGIVHTLASGARKEGYQVAIVAGRGQRSDSDFIVQNKVARLLNVFYARLFDADGFQDSRRTKRLIGFIEKYKPDIVHLHNLHGYYLNAPILIDYLKRQNIQTVITLHDFWLTSPHCAYPKQECSGKCGRCKGLKRYPRAWRTNRSEINLKLKKEFLAGLFLVAPSKQVQTKFKQYCPIYIPHGVDFKIFKPQVKNKDVNLLAVATKWHDIKNPDALKRIAERMPSDWTMTVIGKDAPVSSRIIVIDSLNKSDLAKLMARSSVLLSPAHHEAFGMTVLESLAAGTPVVVQRGTAPEELIEYGGGEVVDFDNPDLVMSAVEKVVGTSVSTELSSELMIERYLKLYDSLIGASAK